MLHEQKSVDRIAIPIPIRRGRCLWPDRRSECPVSPRVLVQCLVCGCLGPLVDPRLEERNLLPSEWLTLRGHARGLVRVGDALEKQAARPIGRLDCGPMAPAGHYCFGGVQPELTLLFERAVASKTPVFQQ